MSDTHSIKDKDSMTSEIPVDTRIFKLKNFTPVGFKQPNYPVKICPLCRGNLTNVCTFCAEKNLEKCNVLCYDSSGGTNGVPGTNGVYYHVHCYSFMVNSNKKK